MGKKQQARARAETDNAMSDPKNEARRGKNRQTSEQICLPARRSGGQQRTVKAQKACATCSESKGSPDCFQLQQQGQMMHS